MAANTRAFGVLPNFLPLKVATVNMEASWTGEDTAQRNAIQRWLFVCQNGELKPVKWKAVTGMFKNTILSLKEKKRSSLSVGNKRDLQLWIVCSFENLMLIDMFENN